jgi:hypothetical protein
MAIGARLSARRWAFLLIRINGHYFREVGPWDVRGYRVATLVAVGASRANLRQVLRNRRRFGAMVPKHRGSRIFIAA